jgi:hypothetical protein
MEGEGHGSDHVAAAAGRRKTPKWRITPRTDCASGGETPPLPLKEIIAQCV